MMTIDVEDWYHSSLDLFKDSSVAHGGKPDSSVVDNVLKTLDLLSKTNNTATFFILGTVAQHYPDVVKEIVNQKHEVATHGYHHRLVYDLTADEFRADIELSFEHLSAAGCPAVLGYRAPYWSITKHSLWALDVLREMGFKYDSSIFPIRRGLYGIPDANPHVHECENGLWEFPPATVRMLGMNWPIAGGGYLRMAPYRIVASAIRRSTGREPRVFYFHPYELDPTDVHLKHKVRSAGTLAYWVQQIVGRRSSPEKLERLLSEFNFTSISCVLEQLQTADPESSDEDTGDNRRG